MALNEREGNWFVPVSGDSAELNKFAEFVSKRSKRYQIRKEGAGYIFAASQFAQLREPAAVIVEARKVVPELKGRAKLMGFEVSSIEVGSAVWRTVGNNREVHSYEVASLNALETANVEFVDAESGEVTSTSTQPQPKKKQLDLAYDTRISNALRSFSLPSSWPTLYKTYESMLPAIGKNEHDAENEIVKKGWATPNELDRFHHFAQYYDSAVSETEFFPKDKTGLGGRHSPESKKAKKAARLYTKPIMHPQEAEDVIRRILSGWLEENE